MSFLQWGGSDSSRLCVWCCRVDTVTVTAASLAGAGVTCGSVERYVFLMRASSGNGLAKGVALHQWSWKGGIL